MFFQLCTYNDRGSTLQLEKKVRILFGTEPQIKRRRIWKQAEITQEIQDFWLDRGISPFLCGAVVKTIERIKSGQLEFKAMDNLHGKLYITETNATLGSSNFSKNGLTVLHEANRYYFEGSYASEILQQLYELNLGTKYGSDWLKEELNYIVSKKQYEEEKRKRQKSRENNIINDPKENK